LTAWYILLKDAVLYCIQLIHQGTLHHRLRSYNPILGLKCAYHLLLLLLRCLTALLVFFTRG